MARLDAASELSRAITRLLLAEPFLGRLLAGIPRQLDESVPTAGVAVRRGGSVVLVVNPTFFTKQIRRIERYCQELWIVKLIRRRPSSDPRWAWASFSVVS